MKKAFTLAEVLITLMIIGIVAALTIPSVISNYQQQEFKTGLKKAVSVLNEAIQTNIAQEGETPYQNVNLFNYLKRHMNLIKTSTVYSCYSEEGNFDGSNSDETGFCGGDSNSGLLVGNSVFYTADGMRFEIPFKKQDASRPLLSHESGINIKNQKSGYGCPYSYAPNWCFDVFIENGFCGSYGLASNPNNTTNTPCVVMVDVNGDKKPNALEGTISAHSGNPVNSTKEYTYPSPTDKKLSDIFTIMITDEKAVPFGVVAQRAMYSK